MEQELKREFMPLSNLDLQNNKIDGTPVEFTNSNITISGNHNTIKFGKNFKARNFDIRIEGNNSTIISHITTPFYQRRHI